MSHFDHRERFSVIDSHVSRQPCCKI